MRGRRASDRTGGGGQRSSGTEIVRYAGRVARRIDRVADPDERSRGKRAGRLRLVMLGGEALAKRSLPDEGTLVIGRGADCDIRIEDTSISRRHARVVIGPELIPELSIEDLGSSNATSVRGVKLVPGVPTRVALDEVITLGAIGLVIQQHTPTAPHRTLWGHGYFEPKLADECARARRAGTTFALLRVRADGRAIDALSDAIREGDVIGIYAPGEWEILCVDATAAEAARIAAMIVGVAATARVAIAMFPADGGDGWALTAVANARLADGALEAAAVPPSAIGPMALLELVDRVAAGDLSALIVGEPGTGKEIIAERIHARSRRAGRPLGKLSCAAVPEALIERELFGHEKGAFPGATVARPGVIEQADGGSVFLDGISELPAATQAKLLRVIDLREVRRVGATKPRPIDVRFLAATQRELGGAIAAERFREDLHARLAGVVVHVPPLRERPTEIAPLVEQLAAGAARRLGRPAPRVTPAALARLRAYRWPGNVRELRSIIERATFLCEAEIDLAHLPEDRLVRPEPAAPPPAVEFPDEAPTDVGGDASARERQAIEQALARTSGNQTKAAKLLGVSRRTLSNQLDRHGLARPRKRS